MTPAGRDPAGGAGRRPDSDLVQWPEIADRRSREHSRTGSSPGRQVRCLRRACAWTWIDDGGPMPRFCPGCGLPFGPGFGPGDTIAGRYHVEEVLPAGGFGWVYLARAMHLDGILVVLKERQDPERATEAWDRERWSLVNLDHPNLVRAIDFVTVPIAPKVEDRQLIVMEYADGLPLSDLSAKAAGDVTVERVVAYVADLLAALDYLHGEGLLYCDMKPENAILTRDRVKVIDLGAVRPENDASPPIISPHYAPARWRDEVRANGWTVQADIHTVGQTLRELYGLTPLANRSGVDEADASLDRIIGRAVVADPAQRFRSAAEMAGQLQGVLQEVVGLRRVCASAPALQGTAPRQWRGSPSPTCPTSAETPARAPPASPRGGQLRLTLPPGSVRQPRRRR